ncbi:MAG TPA: hypothetical protein ENI60_07475 [Candidatus Fraserbacteria bacterium]|nr:hypothetical protein [Candidatus Fraserbacteria bacterium]
MSLWTLNAVVFFAGLILEVGVIWLLLAQVRRVPSYRIYSPAEMSSLARSALSLLFLAFLLQLAAAFLPFQPITGSWFIAAAALSLLPALLLWRARRRGAAELAEARRREPSPEPMEETAAEHPSRPEPELEFEQRLEAMQQVIVAHPEGITLVQLGEELEVAWRQLTGAAHELLRRGQAEKQGKFYLPPGGR